MLSSLSLCVLRRPLRVLRVERRFDLVTTKKAIGDLVSLVSRLALNGAANISETASFVRRIDTVCTSFAPQSTLFAPQYATETKFFENSRDTCDLWHLSPVFSAISVAQTSLGHARDRGGTLLGTLPAEVPASIFQVSGSCFVSIRVISWFQVLVRSRTCCQAVSCRSACSLCSKDGDHKGHKQEAGFFKLAEKRRTFA